MIAKLRALWQAFKADPCALKHTWGPWGDWYRVNFRYCKEHSFQVRYRECVHCEAKQREEKPL